jgi:hypothetical protein
MTTTTANATSKHRVLQLPATTKAAAQTARTKSRKTMRAWLAEATEQRLPALVLALRALGLGADGTGDGSERKAARWRFDEATLAALAAASEQTGLPQTLLLSLVVRQAASEQEEVPAPPKTPKAKGEKTVRQKRVADAKPAKAAPSRKATRKGAK